MEQSWQAQFGLLDRWRQQGQRCTPPPHRMPIWEEGGRQYTLCAWCKTLLFLEHAPYCQAHREQGAGEKRAARRKRKRAKVAMR